jgi:hypothetical protein
MGINVSSFKSLPGKGKEKKKKKSQTTGLIGLLTAHLCVEIKQNKNKKKDKQKMTGVLCWNALWQIVWKKRGKIKEKLFGKKEEKSKKRKSRYLGSPGNRRRDKCVAEGCEICLPLLGCFCHVWPA